MYAGLGVHELIFDFRSDGVEESMERMERFAELAELGRDAIRR